jgi:hypothetical protein
MGGEGREAQIEKSSKIPAARREDSTSRVRIIWEKLKGAVETLSGAHRLPEASVSEKTPIPSSENDGNYRMVCLQKMDYVLKGVSERNMFWEQDFGTVMARAKAAFNRNGDGSDHINQEICARMLGVSFQMMQMEKMELFVKVGGGEYLKWGEKNLMDPEMRELCFKMLKKIAQMSESPRVS